MKLRLPLSPAPLAVLAALTLALPLTAPTLFAKEPTSMIVSADSVPVKYPEDFTVEMEMSGGELAAQNMSTKVYKLGNKQRVDMNAMGQNVTTLVDADTQKMTTLMHSQKLATVMSMEAGSLPLDMNELTAEAAKSKYKELGPETIDGVETIKYEVSDETGKQTAHVWADKKTKYPVKIQPTEGGMTITWKNLSEEKPDPSLFTVPADYKVMDMGNLNPAMLDGLKDMMK